MIIITDAQIEETQERQNGERNFNPIPPMISNKIGSYSFFFFLK
jgi:hypothetical protein